MSPSWAGRGRPLLWALVLVVGSLVAAAGQGQPGTVWVWSGAVTSTSAVVKAKVRGAFKDLNLLYDIDRRMQGARRVPAGESARADTAGVVTFTLDGLIPDTRYYYTVADGDRRTLTGELRTFKDGAYSFDFATASCAGGNMLSAVSNSAIFTNIEIRRPLFFLHTGDFHYSNISRNDLRLFQRAYDAVLTQPRQASLYRHVPIVYVWDDHDFGPNDSDRTSPARDAARAAYTQAVPHYPLTLDGGRVTTIQQEFTVGRVRFIVSDLRSERDPAGQPDGPGKSMLGARQREWLDAAFARAAAERWPLVVWVSTVPWITRTGSKEDGWEPYASERRWLADRLEGLGLTHRLLLVAGDAHMLAIDDGTNSNYVSTAKPGTPGFPVLQASPLDRSPTIKGGPYSHGVSAESGQYAWVQVQDDGAELRITVTGHDRGGRQVPGMRLQMTCAEDGCAVVREAS